MRKILSLMIALVFCFALTPMAMGAIEVTGGDGGTNATGTGGQGGLVKNGDFWRAGGGGGGAHDGTNDGDVGKPGNISAGGLGGGATSDEGTKGGSGGAGNGSGDVTDPGIVIESGGGGGNGGGFSNDNGATVQGGRGASNATTGGAGGAATYTLPNLNAPASIAVTTGDGDGDEKALGGAATFNVTGNLTVPVANTTITVNGNPSVTIGTVVLEGNLTITGDAVENINPTNLTVAAKSRTLNGDLSVANRTVKFEIPEEFDITDLEDEVGNVMLTLVGSTVLTSSASTNIEIEVHPELELLLDDVIALVAIPSTAEIGGTPPSVTTITAGDYSFRIDYEPNPFENGNDYLIATVVPNAPPRSSSSGGCSATGFAPFAVLALLGMAALRRRA